MTNAWQHHIAEVTASDEVFGTDPVGSLIGTSYQTAHQIAAAIYSSVSRSISGFGGALHSIADDFDETDKANGEDIVAVTKFIS
ncbi:hypothetical protein Aoc01nite_11340 [Actinoplanes octamycinicus]|nr:hypothetical protein Aoc01nite_11340 [Actinoplanes octamycinicus]